MIKTHSDDPDVQAAARTALDIINEVLYNLPKAESYDYGGHVIKLNDYGVCITCTAQIAEAQAASKALTKRAEAIEDETIREHLDIAARLFYDEAEAAVIRAELHNGHATEPILNRILAFLYDRKVHDDYNHTHHGGQV